VAVVIATPANVIHANAAIAIKMVKKSKKNILNKKMTFAELIQKDRAAAMKLAEKGMFCCGCPMAMTETIEEGAEAHGLNPDKLINELNKKSKKK
jgi:hybrid cluster-associated redox disulfide protein